MGYERNYTLACGLEAVYGDGGSSPNDIPAFFDGLPEATHEKHENPTYGGSLQRNKFFLGKSTLAVPVKFFLKGSGTAGTAPEIGKLLQILGMGETIVAVTSVTYSPVNTGQKSAGITINLDGTEYVLKGARAESLRIPLEAGNPVVCEMQVRGLYSQPTASALSTPSFDDAAVVPPIVDEMALTIGTFTHRIPRMEFELRNVLSVLDSINAANRGISMIDVVGREWGGTAMIEVDSNIDIEAWNNLETAAELAIASTGFGAAGNLIKITTSCFQIEDVKPAVLDGIKMYEIAFRINKHATLASEFSLVFL